MSVLDDVFGKEPEHRTVEFILDHDLREKLATANYDLEMARLKAGRKDVTSEDRAAIAEAQERVDDLVPLARGRLIRFHFQALDPTEYDALKGAHRPTEAQRTEARKAEKQAPEWNTGTFPAALIAKACVLVESPSGTAEGLSVEDAERLWKSRSYNDAERAELSNTALNATMTRMRVDLPKDG